MEIEKNEIVLRPVFMADAMLLYYWRNDPIVRAASHHQEGFCFDDHLVWLQKSIDRSDERRIYVAELSGKPVGTVRSDLVDGGHELSWTVDPEFRGRGIGKIMVNLLADQIPGPIFAEVKIGNLASIKIAEAVGMTLVSVKDDILSYRKEQ